MQVVRYNSESLDMISASGYWGVGVLQAGDVNVGRLGWKRLLTGGVSGDIDGGDSEDIDEGNVRRKVC